MDNPVGFILLIGIVCWFFFGRTNTGSTSYRLGKGIGRRIGNLMDD
jgi:hypothetical protein